MQYLTFYIARLNLYPCQIIHESILLQKGIVFCHLKGHFRVQKQNQLLENKYYLLIFFCFIDVFANFLTSQWFLFDLSFGN